MSETRYDPAPLVAARRARLASQEEVGKLAGLDRNTIRNVERGHGSNQSVRAVAEALGVDVARLNAGLARAAGFSDIAGPLLESEE
jgi:transcriptional regulator with XRE-family HTH domain